MPTEVPTWDETEAVSEIPTWDDTVESVPRWEDTTAEEKPTPSLRVEVPMPGAPTRFSLPKTIPGVHSNPILNEQAPKPQAAPEKSNEQELRMLEANKLTERFRMAMQLTEDGVKQQRLRENYEKQIRALGVEPISFQPDALTAAIAPTVQFQGDPESIKAAFPGKTGEVLAGVNKAAASAASAFTSPLGVATLGQGALSAGAQRAISGGFAVDMARHIPGQVAEAVDAVRAGDTERAAEAITGVGLTGIFVAGAGKHALEKPSAGKTAAKELDAAVRSAELPEGEIRFGQEAAKPTFNDGPALVKLAAEQAEKVAPATAAVLKDLTGQPEAKATPPTPTTIETPQPKAEIQKGESINVQEKGRQEEGVLEGLTAQESESANMVMRGEVQLSELTPRLRARVREALSKSSEAEDALSALKIDTQGKVFDAVQGIPVAAWNGSIDAVRLAIKSGRIAAEAVDEGLKWLKENHPELNFNEAEYRERILAAVPKAPAPQFGVQSERKGTTALRFLADSPEFQAQFPVEAKAIQERQYIAQTEKGREAMASAYLEAYRPKDGRLDVEQAWRDLQAPDLMSGADNATHLVTVGRLANEAQRQALEAKNPLDAARAQRVADDALAMVQGKSSGFGQGLQATVQAAEQMFGADAVAKARASITKKQQEKITPEVPQSAADKVVEAVKNAGDEAANTIGIETVLRNVVETSGNKTVIRRLIEARSVQELDVAFGGLFTQFSQTDLVKAFRNLEGKGSGIWEKARERTANAVEKALSPGKKEKLPRLLQDYFSALTSEASKIAKERNPQKKSKIDGLSPEEQLREIYSNREKYADALDRAQEIIAEKYADNPTALAWLESRIGIMHDTPFSDRTIGTIFQRRAKAEGVNFSKAQRDKTDLSGVRNKIVKEVADAISPELKPKIEAAFDRWLQLKLDEAAKRNAEADAQKAKSAEERKARKEQEDIDEFFDYENTVSDSIIGGVMAQFDPPKEKPATENLRKILSEVERDVRERISKDESTPVSPEEQMRAKLGRDDMSRKAFEMLQAKVQQMVKEKPELAAAFKGILEAKWDSNKATGNIGSVLKNAASDLDILFRDIMRQSVKDQGNIKDNILRRILSHPALKGIAPEEATRIAEALEREWKVQQQKNLLKTFERYSSLPKVSSRGRAAVKDRLPELIELANAGALTHEAFYNVISDKFGLPKFSPDIAKKVFDLAQKAQDAPVGLARNKATAELFAYIKSHSGATKQELLTSWWYSSVLSGTGTQLVNIVGNAVMMANEFAIMAARAPQSAHKVGLALLRGFAQNFSSGEFKAILKGDMSGRIGKNLGEGSHVFEVVKDSPNPFVRLLANGRFVTRFMVAVDSLFKDANIESKAMFDALKKAKDENVSKADLDRAIGEMLKLTKEERAKAEAQTDAEIKQDRVRPEDRGRRIEEILRQKRPQDIIESSDKFSLEATFNNEPDPTTILGTSYKYLVQFRQQHPAVTPLIPFLRIAANIGNQLLNYSPVGLYRMISRRPAELRKGLPPENAFSLDEYQQLRAKVLISHAAGMALMTAVQMSLDDEDPEFEVSGGGMNVDPNKRKQLLAQGWRPYSVKVGGTWYDYRYSPFALMFSSIGAYADGMRYGNLSEKDLHVKFAAMVKAGYWTILDQAALSTLSDVLGRGNFTSAESMPESMMRFLARTAGGMIPTITKEAESWINPEIQQADHWFDYFQRENPIGRWTIGRPMLNALGEPIEKPRYPWRRIMSPVEDDPVWQALGEKARAGVFMPLPSASAKLNGEKMTDEQFYQYQKETGKLYRQALEQNLEAFKLMSPEQAEDWFESKFSKLREQARRNVK